MLSKPPLIHLISSLPLATILSYSPDLPNPSQMSFSPELMATLPPHHQPTLDQIQTFAKTHLPVYLAQIKSQGCRHDITNPSRPFLDPFLIPPFYYFSLQLLCVSINEIFILPDIPRDPSQSWNPFQDSYMIDSQDPFDFAWPYSICGAQDSDDEDHACCNLSSP
ncbi:hypothetical protein LWI29_032302 [Acer saccharum]|uniref:Uncharacterized protein n=1 Tax=Acer saccharum TaxID=4024 RepID=A0AA39RL81_ACESA|nr:hypothetical protein LWI29_032302 [Acer saccharum]